LRLPVLSVVARRDLLLPLPIFFVVIPEGDLRLSLLLQLPLLLLVLHSAEKRRNPLLDKLSKDHGKR
jgi:hypothetical protein